MNNFLISAVIGLASISSFAETKEVTVGLKANCLPAAELDKTLRAEGQTKILVANDSAFQHPEPVDDDPFARGTMLLYKDKGRFTVVFYYPEKKMSCVMISGFGMTAVK